MQIKNSLEVLSDFLFDKGDNRHISTISLMEYQHRLGSYVSVLGDTPVKQQEQNIVIISSTRERMIRSRTKDKNTYNKENQKNGQIEV